VRRGRARKAKILALAIAALVLVLGLAQLLLPGIAADTISSRIARHGRVQHVAVSAWPAVELLWGSVDTVTVTASRLTLTPAESAALLREANGVARMDVTVGSMREGPLQLGPAWLRKRGSELVGEALMSGAAVAAALPAGLAVRLVSSGDGSVRVRASGRFFGLLGSVDAVARASDGKLVAEPVGAGLHGLRLVLFSDPNVYVQGVGAVLASSSPLSYRLSMTARLR
jgi:hypothetical protein